jgi:uncharacterized protein YggE
MNKRNLALIAGILAIGLVAATIIGGQSMTAAAQQQEQNSTEHPTVSTNGTVSMDVKPDKVSVTIGVETDGKTAAEAAAANAELMEKVLAVLSALGIRDYQMTTSSYNVFPIYESRPAAEACIMIYPPPPECLPKNEIVGYKATNHVTVAVNASFDAGKVIDAAVEAGANNVSGAYFFVSQERQQEIRDSLIGEAIANARSRADKAAEAVDMQVIGVKSINLSDVYFPVFYRDLAVQEASGTPILPGQQQVTMTVQVVFTTG